jgi:hypothetical protein
MNTVKVNERNLALLGRKWKAASKVEVDCFQAAAALGGEIQALLESATIFAELLEGMTDVQAGQAVLAHFGKATSETQAGNPAEGRSGHPADSALH